MPYYHYLINKAEGKIYLPAAEANLVIERLRAENDRLKRMLQVSREVNEELRRMILSLAPKFHKDKCEVICGNTLERVR